MTNIVGVGVHFNGLVLLASDLNRWRDMGLTNLCVHRSPKMGEGKDLSLHWDAPLLVDHQSATFSANIRSHQWLWI